MGFFKGITKIFKGIVDIVSGAINLVLGLFTGSLFKPNLPDMGSQRDSGVESRLPANTNNKLPVLYGSAWIKGQVIHGENSSDFKTAYYVLALSEYNGQASRLVNVYWQEYRLNLTSNADISSAFSTTQQQALFAGQQSSTQAGLWGTVVDKVYGSATGDIQPNYVASATDGNGNAVSDFNNNISVQFFPNGMPTDRSGLPNTTWFQSATNLMSNISFVVVTVKYVRDKNIVSLADMTFQVANLLYQPNLVIQDYLSNTRYGCGLPLTSIDTTSLANLGTYANQTIPVTQGSTSFNLPRYAINGVVNCNENTYNNLLRLAQSCGSLISINRSNQLGVFVDMPQTTVAYAFDASNMVGSAQLTRQNLDNTPNRLEYKWKNGSPQTKDQSDTDLINLTAGLIPINAPINQISLAYDHINNQGQSRRLAILNLNSEQLDLGINFSTDHRAIGLQSGDLITVTDINNGWTAKKFRIGSIAETEQSDGQIKIDIDAKEYSDDIYVDSMVVVRDPSPNVNTPSSRFINSYTPTAPVVANAMATTAIPSFSINVTTPSVRADYFEIYYSSDPVSNFVLLTNQSATTADGTFPLGVLISTPITGLLAGTYYFQVKFYNDDLASNASPSSLSFMWMPAPSSTSTGLSVNFDWSPPNVLVPANFDGTMPVVNQSAILCVFFGTAQAQFSTAATDAALPNGQWRIATYTTTAGLTVTSPVVQGLCAQFTVSGMTQLSATLTASINYRTTLGTLVTLGDTILQVVQQRSGAAGADGPPGMSGNQNTIVYLYQWSTLQPMAPTGTSTFTWGTLTNANYTGANNWTTTVPTNPGTAGIQLWLAQKGISALSTATTTTVDWTMNVMISNFTQNGQAGSAGLSRAVVSVYQWSLPPAPSITGTSTYTWSNGSFSPTPSGWTQAPSTATSGQNLYRADVVLVASASTVTSTVDWTTALISVVGFAPAGTPGNSSRNAYALATGIVTPTGTVTTSGNNTFPSNTDFGVTWASSWTAALPSPATGQTIYISNGIYDGTNTLWGTPYLATFRVGSLSALSVNTGSLSVTGTLSTANGNFSVDSTGNVMIRNAVTGGRLVITNTTIKVYDASNVLRVQIGDLTA